jgi:hypothetical protein
VSTSFLVPLVAEGISMVRSSAALVTTRRVTY